MARYNSRQYGTPSLHPQLVVNPQAPPAPPPSDDPVIAPAGDIACDPADPNFNGGAGTTAGCHTQATADLLVERDPDAVLTVGDARELDGTLAKHRARRTR